MKSNSPSALWRCMKLAPLAVLLAVASGCGQNPMAPAAPSSDAMTQTVTPHAEVILPYDEPAGPADPGSIGGAPDGIGGQKIAPGSGGSGIAPQKKNKKPKKPGHFDHGAGND